MLTSRIFCREVTQVHVCAEALPRCSTFPRNTPIHTVSVTFCRENTGFLAVDCALASSQPLRRSKAANCDHANLSNDYGPQRRAPCLQQVGAWFLCRFGMMKVSISV